MRVAELAPGLEARLEGMSSGVEALMERLKEEFGKLAPHVTLAISSSCQVVSSSWHAASSSLVDVIDAVSSSWHAASSSLDEVIDNVSSSWHAASSSLDDVIDAVRGSITAEAGRWTMLALALLLLLASITAVVLCAIRACRGLSFPVLDCRCCDKPTEDSTGLLSPSQDRSDHHSAQWAASEPRSLFSPESPQALSPQSSKTKVQMVRSPFSGRQVALAVPQFTPEQTERDSSSNREPERPPKILYGR